MHAHTCCPLTNLNDRKNPYFIIKLRKGYHFFRPDTVATPTPRSAREAWGGVYKPDVSDKHEKRNERIMFVIVAIVLIGLSIL